MRLRPLLLGCAMLACGDPEPSATEQARVLAELETMERRLQDLEDKLERQAAAMPDPDTSHTEPVRLGKLTLDVMQERAARDTESLSIEVTPTGYVIDGETLQDDALRRRLDEVAADRSHASLIVRSEPGVPHERVVALLEMAKARGITRLAIASVEERDG